MDASIEARAWGFTADEYIQAFSLIASREQSVEHVNELFSQLREHPGHSIGGEPELFALLSLVSQSSRERVKAIMKWSDEQFSIEQQKSLSFYRKLLQK